MFVSIENCVAYAVLKFIDIFKAFMKQKFIALCERTFKTVIQFFCTFALQRFVDEMFQFEFFVLSANYVTLYIMRHQKVDYKVVFL